MFFVARSDPAEVFDPIEETFDMITLLIKSFGETMTMLAIDFIGNVRHRALSLDLTSDPVGVVGLVAKQDISLSEIGQEHGSSFGVVGLTGREDQLDRQATGIGEGVNFGAQPSSRAAHTMNAVVFFTLAAC